MKLSRSRGLFLALVAVVSIPAVCGAELLTADGAVKLALQKNPQVVNSAASVLDAKSGLFSSISGIAPRVSASLSRSGSWTRNNSGQEAFGSFSTAPSSLDIDSYSTTPGLSASWSVLDLSALSGLSAARQSLKAARWYQVATRNNVALGVRRQFYAVVQATHLARVNADALKLARDNERRVRALFEVGSVSKSDVLKAQVQTAQSQLDSLTSAHQITTQRISLASALGLVERSMGAIDTTLSVTPAEYDEALLLAEAGKNRPDLLAAHAGLKSAESSRWSARFSRLPYVTVSGSAGFKTKSSTRTTVITPPPPDTVSSAESTTDRNYRATIALNWDLFDGFATEAQNASAQARLVRAQESYDALQRNLEAEVQQALLSYREALETVEVADRAVESATENLKLTQQKYNVGSATILDLIDAQVQLQRAENQDVSARAGVRIAEAGIRRVSGRSD